MRQARACGSSWISRRPMSSCWRSRSRIRALSGRGTAQDPARALLALESLRVLGAPTLRLLMLSVAYRIGLDAGTSNDYLQRHQRFVADHLTDRLALLGAVAVSAGVRKELVQQPIARRVRLQVVQRVAGALAVLGRLDALERSVREGLRAATMATPAVASYKTALQELYGAAGKDISYEAVAAVGPHHAREFTIKVRYRGRSATGTGASKKIAGEAAAQAFLSEFAPRRLEQLEQAGRRPGAKRQTPSTSLHVRGSLDSLAAQLRISRNGLGTLSHALTHGSYAQVADEQRALAQLGAAAEEVLIRLLITSDILHRSDQLRAVDDAWGYVGEPTTAASVFDRLGLQIRLER